VQDLPPYLGAFGHALIMSDDMRDAVHSHPSPGPESDISRGFGGPDVTFEGYMPRPGLYRAWSQFLRGGTLTRSASRSACTRSRTQSGCRACDDPPASDRSSGFAVMLSRDLRSLVAADGGPQPNHDNRALPS
jgi:hypothetical protein